MRPFYTSTKATTLAEIRPRRPVRVAADDDRGPVGVATDGRGDGGDGGGDGGDGGGLGGGDGATQVLLIVSHELAGP